MVEINIFELIDIMIMFFFCGMMNGSKPNTKLRKVSIIFWFISWVIFVVFFVILG